MKNFTMIPNEIFEDNQISIPSRYLYMLLLKHCGQTEYCFPGQKRLGKIMNRSDRQIRVLLKELENEGLISRIRRGWNRSNTYRVSKDLDINRNLTSPLIGSKFPLHSGNTVPPINTYRKTKGKRSEKGLEQLRDIVERFRH